MDSTSQVAGYMATPGNAGDHIVDLNVAAAEAAQPEPSGVSTSVNKQYPTTYEQFKFPSMLKCIDPLTKSCRDTDAGSHIVDVVVAAGQPQPSTRSYTRIMYRAATRGDWDVVQKIYSEHPEWIRMPLGAGGNTALHIAAGMNQKAFVKKLIVIMAPEYMEIPNADGNTAFCMAAISGNVEIAKLLFQKNKRLAFISGHQGMLPIELAALTGHREMVRHIFKMIWVDRGEIVQDHIRQLFFLTISTSLYDMAIALLMENTKLSTSRNREGLTALQVLAHQPPTKKFVANDNFQERDYKLLLHWLYESMEDEGVSLDYLGEAMFDAVKSGDIEIVKLICDNTPDLISKVDSKGQTVLHIAVFYRQQRVFNLLLSMGAFKNLIMQSVDVDGNNILHMAGILPPEERFGSSRPNIRMQREELWFKEVEKRVPPVLQIMQNIDKLTPRELYYREHRKLFKEAESAVKAILNNSMVVATLIAAIVFAAAITVPGKDTEVATVTAIFQKKTWYVIFILSNAIALFSSSASVVFYLSILFSSFEEDVFINSLQKRLLFGLIALFVSMATMIVAFTAASFLIFDHQSTWVAYLVASLGCILVFAFLVFHSNLWADFLTSFNWGKDPFQIQVRGRVCTWIWQVKDFILGQIRNP